MRETRYLWTSNLPAQCIEENIQKALECHGKIQSVRFVENGDARGAVVAFMDVKSATKACENVNFLGSSVIKLEYCESTGLRTGVLQTTQVPAPNTEKSVQQSLNLLSEVNRRSDVSGPASLSSTSSRNEERKNRSPERERSVRGRSRSSSVSSGISEVSSVGGSTRRRRGANHRSAENTRSRSDRYRGYEENTNDTDSNCNGGLRGLKITQLPARSTDTSIRDGLFHEYKKHGKIQSVVVETQSTSRFCVITFRRHEDAEKAYEASKDKVFFNVSICVARHAGYDIEDPDLCPPEHAMDEYHPKATKTLFVGNLQTDFVTQNDLQSAFEKFGEIIDIDIKTQTNQLGTSYAFIQYTDIKSVVRALNSPNTIKINGKPIKLGFGKSQPTSCIWLDNLASSITENFLTKQFKRFGQVVEVILDKKLMRGLVFFDNTESAQKAVAETKNRALAGRKVQIDYANTECQELFTSAVPRSRAWSHSNFNSGNYDDYREKMYLAYCYTYGKTMPYVEERDRGRRHFEELRQREDYERDPPIYVRPDSFRESRRGDRTSYSSSGNVYSEYRSPGSGGGKRNRYFDEVQPGTASHKITSGDRKPDIYHHSGSRVRSESPYSIKSSQSRERDAAPDDHQTSRSRSPRRNQHDSVDGRVCTGRAAGRTPRNTDEDSSKDRVPVCYKKSRSRSNRSASLADKERGSSGSRRSSRRRSGETATDKDSPLASQTSPSGVNQMFSSTSNNSLQNHISKTSSSVGAVTKPDGSSSECIQILEKERESLLMELLKLDKTEHETDSESSACTDSVDNKDYSLPNRRVKHELQDVFDYDFLTQEKEKSKSRNTAVLDDANPQSTQTSVDKEHTGTPNGIVESVCKPIDTSLNSKPAVPTATSVCDSNSVRVWETGVVDSETSVASTSFHKRRLNRPKEQPTESTNAATPLMPATVSVSTLSPAENLSGSGGRCYRTKSVTEDVLPASDDRQTTSSQQARPKITKSEISGGLVPTEQQFEETSQRHPRLSNNLHVSDKNRLSLHIPTSNPASAPVTGTAATSSSNNFLPVFMPSPPPSNPPPHTAPPGCLNTSPSALRDPRLSSHLYQSFQHSQTGNTSISSNPSTASSESNNISFSENATVKVHPVLKLETSTDLKNTEKPDSDSTSSPTSRHILATADDDLSDLSDTENETVLKDKSLDERIRLLDAKMGTTEKARPCTVDYSKFKIRKKAEISPILCSVPATSGITSTTNCTVSPVAASTTPSDCRTDTSAFVKSMLSKSAFDQDSSRLEHSVLGSGDHGKPVFAPSVQPLTIGVATGDSSAPSSLSSSGSVSVPYRTGLLNGVGNSLNSHGPAVLTTAVTAHPTIRPNFKMEPIISSGSTTVITPTTEVKVSDYPVKSILKKDISNNSSLPSPNPCNNNNNNSSPFPDSSPFQRTSRPLSSPAVNPVAGFSRPPNSLGRPEPTVLSAPPSRTPARLQTPNPPVASSSSANLMSPSGVSLAGGSVHSRPTVRPGQTNPAPKMHTSPSVSTSKGSSAPVEDSKKQPVGKISSNGPVKRKAFDLDDSKKTKVSKLENKPALDDSLFGPGSFIYTGKDKKHKKTKSEKQEDKVNKKGASDDSNQSKQSSKDVSLLSDAKKQKRIDEKTDKKKKKKERSADFMNDLCVDDPFDNLFNKFGEEERKKKEKKKRDREARDDNPVSVCTFDEKFKKEKKRHHSDKNKQRSIVNDKEDSSSHYNSDTFQSDKNKSTNKEYKKKKDSNKSFDFESEDSWKPQSSAASTTKPQKNFCDLDFSTPYESMYDKIKRRASKDAEIKRQTTSKSGDSKVSVQQQKKKSKHKKQKSFLDSDSDLETGSIKSSLTNETNKSAKKSKGKSSKVRLGKRLPSDENNSDYQAVKRSRLDSDQSEKPKKKSSRKKDDPFSKRMEGRKSMNKKEKFKEERERKKTTKLDSLSHKKGRVTVDSVFGESSSDTSRASSPLGRLPRLDEHSSDESKTTPSTEPMENSEGECNSSRLKSTEEDWKSSLPSSPLPSAAELDQTRHLKNSPNRRQQSPEKGIEDITISEDLPCLEKQSDEDLMEKSPRSIDDEPPDHLESIYDSPCDLKESSTEQVVEEQIIYDDIELTNRDEVRDDQAEQSLAVASIIDSTDTAIKSKLPVKETILPVTPVVQCQFPEKDGTSDGVSSVTVPTSEVKPPAIVEPEISKPKVSNAISTTPTETKIKVAKSAMSIPDNSRLVTVAATFPQPGGNQMLPPNIVSPKVPPHLPPVSVSSGQPVVGSTSSNTATTRLEPGSKMRGEADAPDFTSYVQSVIERVKQEKDKENQHSREKTFKRQKKYTPSSTSTPSAPTVSTSAQSSNVPPAQPQPSQMWSLGLGSAVKMSGNSDLNPLVPPAVPSIPGVNVCTPVLPPLLNKLETPGGKNPATMLTTVTAVPSPLPGTPAAIAPQVISQVHQQVVAVAPVSLRINPILPPGAVTPAEGQEHKQPPSPQVSTVTSDEARPRRKIGIRGKRSGSLSKTPPEKSDQLLSLDEVINDVLRKNREGSTVEDGKRADTSVDSSLRAETSMEMDESPKIKDSLNTTAVDPYEPNFDESPPSQVNMNRELHHRVRPNPSAGPPGAPCQPPPLPSQAATAPTTTTVAATVSTTIPTTSSLEAVAPPAPSAVDITAAVTKPDNISVVIDEVCQGNFDVQTYLEKWRNRGEDDPEMLQVTSPHQAEPPAASRPTEQASGSTMTNLITVSMVEQRALLALASLQQQHMAMHQLPGSVGFQAVNLPSTLPAVTTSGVQLGVVNNSQPYPSVQAVEERGYPIERVPNPGLGQLTVRTGLGHFGLPTGAGVDTLSPRVGTPGGGPASAAVSAGSSATINASLIQSGINLSGSDAAQPSPVSLVSRPSSNPMVSRTSSAAGPHSFTPKTPDQSSPSSTGTPRPPLTNSTSGPTPAAASFIPTFDGVNAPTPDQISIYYHYMRQLGALAYPGIAAATAVPGAAAAATHPPTNPLDFTPVRLLAEGMYPSLSTPADVRASAATPDGRPGSQQPLAPTVAPPPTATPNTAIGMNPLIQIDLINDMTQLLGQCFRLVWKGRLSLKNEEAQVQMHYVHGNNDLIKECMSMAGHSMDQPLKIVQRMRLEAAQLEGVQRKMQQESDFCVCLALASGANDVEYLRMSTTLRNSFIKYMQEKMAAGIINVYHPEYQQGLYVVHIFPPCEFSQTQLQLCAPELLQRITRDDIPHLLVVITTV